ncbi:hypothetical protein MATL_G00122420 [Megalops atlanticus]|uniref:Soluble interferon alpha/beta receptor OPG204 n=1 Tax=Megalops atlanticus TaxID=7932 RepID=A0A9D3PYY7_MEGAT|nr:hypothetical protein MATL_G00122420 [Megalops atlanticus]
MSGTLTFTGSSSLCHILAVALVCTFCLLQAEANPEVKSPKILMPKSNKIKASLGKQLVIPCKADPGFPDDFTLIYWLVNNSFIEKAYPNGRVRESEEGVYTKVNKTFIWKDLVFEMVTSEDFEATYTCVVNNPAGVHSINLKLSKSRQRKHFEAKKKRAVRRRRLQQLL